jgi:O-acetyl-ADP-ribose deacetylase (regulator of RNase III)
MLSPLAERPLGAAVLALVVGDITTIAADAIVNAANSALMGGGGVDGAIHRQGGPAIMAELRARYPSGMPTGTAVATGAGNLPARWVIHAVGPVWAGGGHGEREQLASAYRSALAVAAGLGARTVNVPAISAGIYGYPLAEAAEVAVGTVADVLRSDPGSIERATFVLRTQTIDAFRRALAAIR